MTDLTRRHFLARMGQFAVGSVWGASLLARDASARGEKRPPNVLIILADDQGWGDLSVHGNTNLRTPHIDSLAREGALLERFFVCPVCAPTRAEFLTGPLSFARRRARRLDRAGTAESR